MSSLPKAAAFRARAPIASRRPAREDALYSLKSMDGVIPKLGVGAVRINSDIVTWPKRGNNVRREKMPAAPGNRYVGLVLLFSTENGEPLAIFPDGVMQRMRVGAANGLGVKYLARKDAKTVGILGSGWQAGAQLMAVCAVRSTSRPSAASAPMRQNRDAFARQMSEALGVDVMPVDTARGGDQGRRHRDVRDQHARPHLLRSAGSSRECI